MHTQEIRFDKLLDTVFDDYTNKTDRDIVGKLLIEHELEIKKRSDSNALSKLTANIQILNNIFQV